jgi:hypothetical protein
MMRRRDSSSTIVARSLVNKFPFENDPEFQSLSEMEKEIQRQ